MSQNVVLSCPNCATRFSAPVDHFVPNGRQVRCSQCQHMWFHAAPSRERSEPTGKIVRTAPERAAVVAPPDTADHAPRRRQAEAQDADAPIARPSRRPEKRGGGLFSWLLWLIALALLLAILAYVFREPLRNAVPQAAPWLDRYTGTVDKTAQGLVGRTEHRDPFKFENFHYDVKEYDGEKQILVEADLLNTGDKDMPAPSLRVRVVDAERETLHASVIGPEDMSETVAAGQSVRYFVRIPEAPSDFESVLLNIEGK